MTEIKAAPRSDARLTRAETLKRLLALNTPGDVEAKHAEADELLVAFVRDEAVREAYRAVPKWYA